MRCLLIFPNLISLILYSSSEYLDLHEDKKD